MSSAVRLIGRGLGLTTGLVDTLSLSPEVLPMPRTRPPYSPEFRRQQADKPSTKPGQSQARSIDLRRQSGVSHQSLGSAVSIGTTFGWHNR